MPAKSETESVSVRKIEVVQVIQNAENDIPLIAGKRTYIRVYLSPEKIAKPTRLVGYVNAKLDGKKLLSARRCIEDVFLRRGISLEAQRLDWTQSLNFCLNEGDWDSDAQGKLEIELKALTIRAVNGACRAVGMDGANAKTEVCVVRSPKVHCRIVAFKHRDNENLEFVQPEKGQADAIRRFVESTFPASDFHWSSLMIAAPREFRAVGRVARESDRTHGQITQNYKSFFLQMLQIREQDIVQGRDPKTLYLGLIADPSDRFGGAAMDSPQFAAPHVVALTTPDSEGQLGAHELAHVLGRRHPGIPNRKFHGSRIGQSHEPDSTSVEFAEDIIGISEYGYLSDQPEEPEGKLHHGVDTRQRGTTPDLLPYDHWFDLMTYRHPKWVSNLTYIGLLVRLQEIADGDFDAPKKIDPEANNDSKATRQDWAWTVIGEYNVRRKSGRIRYLAPGNYMTPMPLKEQADSPPRGDVQLAWYTGELDDKNNPDLAKVDVHVRNYRNLDGSSSIGVFQHTLLAESLTSDLYRESFKNLVANNGVLKLLVRGVMVDEIRGCDEQKFKKIFEGIEQSTKFELANRPAPGFRGREDDDNEKTQGGLSLQYCVDDGGYYLRYHWQWKNKNEIRDLKVITSIACRRKRNKDSNDSDWQTVSVSDRSRGRIWISPVFLNKGIFEKPGEDTISDDLPVDSADSGQLRGLLDPESFDSVFEGEPYKVPFTPPDDVREKTLEIRVGVTAGFHTKYITLDRQLKLDTKDEGDRKVALSEIEAFGSRNFNNAYLPVLGSREEDCEPKDFGNLAEKRDWYRDTGSATEDVE